MSPAAPARRIPFAERKTVLRGLLDLATGRYPRFLFGGPVGAIVPVFHFHSCVAEHLDPLLAYLAENEYRTIDSAQLEDWVLRGRHPGPRSVMLCFDDARASLWTVGAPLLRRRGQRAVAYAVTGRVVDADRVRPTLDDADGPPPDPDRSDIPFATWPELAALAESGIVDVQAHTHSHRMIPCAPVIDALYDPARPPSALSMPEGTVPEPGMPLFRARSRMSDAWRFHVDESYLARCREAARSRRPPATPRDLARALGPPTGLYETDAERERALREEIDRPRDALKERLPGAAVRQICLPWAVLGARAEALLRESEYATAVADRLGGFRAVRAGDPAYRLMRLKHEYIPCLPGRPRRFLLLPRQAGLK
jgi:hypothetical protein